MMAMRGKGDRDKLQSWKKISRYISKILPVYRRLWKSYLAEKYCSDKISGENSQKSTTDISDG